MRQTLTVRLIGWSFGLGLAVCLLLTGDSAAPRKRQVLGYIGAWTATTDTSYQKFVAALTARHPELLSELNISYVPVNAGTPQTRESSIKFSLAGGAALFVAPTGASALAAKALTASTPLVFATYPDPQRLGLINPGLPRDRPITGVSLADELNLKRIELLRDGFPAIRDVLILADRYWLDWVDVVALQRAAKEKFGLRLTVLAAENEADVQALAQRPELAKFDAWYIPPTYVAYLAESQILALLRQLGKPAIHSTVQEVKNGAVMAYEQDSSFVFAALADLVARVLAGEDARYIPVERPRRYVLAVRADAEALRLGMSPAMLKQADQVYVDAISPAK